MHNVLFADDQVDLAVLRQRALGMRWAGVPEDVIPLTSADPDFKPAAEIRRAMIEFVEGATFPMRRMRFRGCVRRFPGAWSRGRTRVSHRS